MDKELIQQLITWIQSVSPTIWHMAIKQVHTQMIQDVYEAIVGLIFAGVFLWLGIYCWRKANDNNYFDLWAIICLVTCTTIIGSILTLTVPHLIQVWTNPDYAALQTIITLVTKIK